MKRLKPHSQGAKYSADYLHYQVGDFKQNVKKKLGQIARHVKPHEQAASEPEQFPLPFHSSHIEGHVSHTDSVLDSGFCQDYALAV